MGKGLVSLEQYKKSKVLNPNIFEYKQIVRASVMWMSFNEHIQFNDVMFQQLDALMSTDDNQPKGNQTIKKTFLFYKIYTRWFLLLLGWISFQNV